jgi:hypothetical protein
MSDRKINNITEILLKVALNIKTPPDKKIIFD